MKHAGLSADNSLIRVMKLRVAPTPVQEQLLLSYTGSVRAVYNILLYHTGTRYRQRQAELTYDIPDEQLTETVSCSVGGLTRFYMANRDVWVPWWAELPNQVAATAIKALACAYENFFTGKAKYPKYKKKPKSADANVTPVSFHDDECVWVGDGGRTSLLPLSRATRTELGHKKARTVSRVRVVKDSRAKRAHKLVSRGQAQVQEVTYSYTGGYWWVAVRMRVLPGHTSQPQRHPDLVHPDPEAVVGVDAAMGKTFMVLSEPVAGVTDSLGRVKAPQYLNRASKQLIAAQQTFSRCTPGSNRYRKALKRVQKLHGKVAAQRKNWHHQLALTLTERFKMVGYETLNLQGMAKKKKGFNFAKAVYEHGHYQFTQILGQHAPKRDSYTVAVSRWFPSSKTCSVCRVVKAKLLLSERMYDCDACGLHLHRDVNAAINLKHLAEQEMRNNSIRDAGEASRSKPSQHKEVSALPEVSVEATRPQTCNTTDIDLAGVLRGTTLLKSVSASTNV